MKKITLISFVLILILGLSFSVSAHFQLILPTDETISANEDEEIGIQLIFTHPMEASHSMDMDKPVKFGVLNKGREKSLLEELESFTLDGAKSWKTLYETRSPGDYIFYLEPAPYYEEGKDLYLTQYTKIVVNKMGMPTDWEKELGQKAEIIPLTRPYGIWTGNVLRGVVKRDGKVVPNTKVMVEYLNSSAFTEFNDAGIFMPAESFNRQYVKTDSNGVFSYGIPKAGWWGFGAMMKGDKIDGKTHKIGGVIWIKAHDME